MRSNALVNYVVQSYQELRKVNWPSRTKAIRLTFLVLGFCLVTAVFLGVLDFLFGTGHRALLDLGATTSAPAFEINPVEGSPLNITPQ